MRYILILALAALAALSGCTDSQFGKFAVLGNSAIVTCYSGGKIIFHARSTGRVENEANSDGYFARWINLDDQGEPTGKPYYASVSGSCKIVYLDD